MSLRLPRPPPSSQILTPFPIMPQLTFILLMSFQVLYSPTPPSQALTSASLISTNFRTSYVPTNSQLSVFQSSANISTLLLSLSISFPSQSRETSSSPSLPLHFLKSARFYWGCDRSSHDTSECRCTESRIGPDRCVMNPPLLPLTPDPCHLPSLLSLYLPVPSPSPLVFPIP